MRMAQGVEEAALAAAQAQNPQGSEANGIQQQSPTQAQPSQSSSAMDMETTVMAEGNTGLSNL